MTETQSVSGWYFNLWRTTEYRIEHYDNGNSVTRVRSYYSAPVQLYDHTGVLDQQLGSNIDKFA